MAAVKRRRAAPQARLNTQADTMHIVSSVGADIDLLDIAGKPKFAPQRVEIYNLDTVANTVVVFTPDKGVDLTATVPPQPSQPVVIRHPVKTLKTSGTSGTFIIYCYWWDAGTLDWNPEA